MRSKIKCICKICKKEFEVLLGKKRKTCSRKCWSKLISLSEKNSEKVKAFHANPEWRRKQSEIRMGKPSPRKNYFATKKTREKLSNYMKDFYEKNPEEKIKRTKTANAILRSKIGFEEHERAVEEEILNLEKHGFVCTTLAHIRPDFLAKKDGKIYAIEVEFGSIKPEKYENNKFFDDIFWIKRRRDKPRK